MLRCCCFNTVHAYLLYYYSFPPKQIEYKDVNRKIFTKGNVSTESQNAVKLLQVSAKKRNNIKEGAERKRRIVQKLYKNNLRTNLYLHIYKLVLLIMKKHVLLIQPKKTIIHTMIDELKSLLLASLNLERCKCLHIKD